MNGGSPKVPFNNAPFYSYIIAVGREFTSDTTAPSIVFPSGIAAHVRSKRGERRGVAMFSGGVLHGERRRTFFEGVSFGASRLITGDSADDLFEGRGFSEDAWRRLTGNFSYVQIDGGTITVAPDPFGLTRVYTYERNGTVVVSNDLAAMVAFLKETLPGVIRPLLPVLAGGFTFGAHFTRYTAVEGITVLHFGSYLTIDHEAERQASVHVCSPLWREIEDIYRSSDPEGLYQHYLAAGLDDVFRNLERSFSHLVPSDKVFLLSGGQDSRMLLSFVLAAGLKDRFSFFTHGSEDEADSIYAAQLREAFDLQREKDQRRFSTSGFRGDWDASFEWSCRTIFGQRTYDPPVIPFEAEDRHSACLYPGSHGEICHGYYAEKAVRKYASRLGAKTSDVWRDLDFSTVGVYTALRLGKGITDAESREDVKRMLTETMNEFSYMPLEARVDFSYILHRNRFHFGLGYRARFGNTFQISALCSPNLMLARFCIDPRSRSCGQTAFDVVNANCPDALAVPGTFDWDMFAGRARVDVPVARVASYPESITAAKVGGASLSATRREMIRYCTRKADESLSRMRDSELAKVLGLDRLQASVDAGVEKTILAVASRGYVAERIGLF
jgi:hypothetical protein